MRTLKKSVGLAVLIVATSSPAVAAVAVVPLEGPTAASVAEAGETSQKRDEQCITKHEFERIKATGRHTWTMWKVKKVVGFRGWTYVWKHEGRVRFWDHCKKPKRKAYVHFERRHVDWKCDKRWSAEPIAGICRGLFNGRLRAAN